MVIDALLATLGLFILLAALSIVVLALVWLERKLLGRLQGRMGPMVVGPYGILQPVADAIKLMAKEDILPRWANRWVFWIAPVLVFVPSFMVWVTVPFGPNLVIRNLDLGLLYIVAFSVLSIVGLVMAGWSSASKYAVLGSLRSAAQLVSYEIPIIMVILAVAMLAASLNLQTIVADQSPIPYAFLQPLGLCMFVFAGLAEVGRTPFDIFTADSEIVGGPFVEYSGAHWSVFFLAEYINTFALGLLTAILFLGGWQWPAGLPVPLAVAWLLAKTFLVILVIFWFRATFPRFRVDQLMSLSWQVLIPLSFVNIIITGVYLFYGWPAWSLTLMSLAVLGGLGYLVYRTQTAPAMSLARSHGSRGGA